MGHARMKLTGNNTCAVDLMDIFIKNAEDTSPFFVHLCEVLLGRFEDVVNEGVAVSYLL